MNYSWILLAIFIFLVGSRWNSIESVMKKQRLKAIEKEKDQK